VLDENGAPVVGARVELQAGSGAAVAATSDHAGGFDLLLPAEDDYSIRAERLGFYLLKDSARHFAEGENELTVTLNHIQEYTESVDVTYSAPAVDPQETTAHQELENTDALSVPYAAQQDYRSALPLLDGVVADNRGQSHFNGGSLNQTAYTLDGFDISDPATRHLDARVNIDSIQAMEFEGGRFSAASGGSAGSLDLRTKMGDDHWRFAGTNFIPGVSSTSGLHINKWTPRAEFSGPLARGRAWFHTGSDVFYDVDVVPELPDGFDRAQSVTVSNLSRAQVNLGKRHILTLSSLTNLSATRHAGLSLVTPWEATRNLRQRLWSGSVRDQITVARGGLLEFGFASTRSVLRARPQGDETYLITPSGFRGNHFELLHRHSFREQATSSLYLPTVNWAGSHQFKLGADASWESFNQQAPRHSYEVLRADGSLARQVRFEGSSSALSSNLDVTGYAQDRWSPRPSLVADIGIRSEWDRMVRRVVVAPRLAAAWTPRRAHGLKFSAGWGVYHDRIPLQVIGAGQDQTSVATYYLPDGTVQGPVRTLFRVDTGALTLPRFRSASASVEGSVARGLTFHAAWLRRTGDRDVEWVPALPIQRGALPGTIEYLLRNWRQERYEAADFSVRHSFGGRFEWFAGYTRSTARTSAAVEYSLDSPIFAPQARGPLGWDAPNRFHTWGWAPVPQRFAPRRLRPLVRETTFSFLVEYHTGFPFSTVDQEGSLAGAPNSRRLPSYFSVNLGIEKRFRALRWLWAWRGGVDNVTGNLNPNVVNNVVGTPEYLTYGRGQARAFNVRLRMLGRK
jgi:hypothetical protein